MQKAAPTVTLPPAWAFEAPAAWCAVDFISDLHLAADTPRTFEAWARYLRGTPADAVWMLGDWLEAWPGDDARDGDFEQACLGVLREASAGRCIAFMAGNRDFLIGEAMLHDGGVMRLPDPTLLHAFGERVLLSHGDALCLSDLPYQAFRAQVRQPAFIEQFLARPLAERQAIVRSLRDGSEHRKAAEAAGTWPDVDLPAAQQQLQAARATVLIHGHTHRPGSGPVAPGLVRHVLSDWDLDHAQRAEVMRFTARGFERLPLDRAT